MVGELHLYVRNLSQWSVRGKARGPCFRTAFQGDRLVSVQRGLVLVTISAARLGFERRSKASVSRQVSCGSSGVSLI